MKPSRLPPLAINSLGFLIVPLLLFGATQSVRASDLDTLAPGHWYEVADSKLEDVLPDPLPVGYNRHGRPMAIMDEWSGGAFDAKRNRLIVWGGGHNNYSGNELYVFDVAALRWTRLTEPSTDIGGDEASGHYPDGQPRSRHTYDYVEYVPSIDRFCSFGASGQFPSGGTETSSVDCFDFDTNTWETDQYKSVPKRKYESNLNAVSAYDEVTGYVFLHTTSTGDDPRMFRWRPAEPGSDKWKVLTGPDWIQYNLTAEIDPEHRIMIAIGNDKHYAWRLGKSGAARRTNPKWEGDNSIVKSPAPGLAYDPVGKHIVAWHGGATIYVLQVETKSRWRWERRDPPANNKVVPPRGVGVGTYGRFQYVPALDMFIAVNRISENVYFYKPLRDATP